MYYQTFTRKKRAEINTNKFSRIYFKTINKYYIINRDQTSLGGNSFRLGIPRIGGIYLCVEKMQYKDELCDKHVEYLGFRGTKKFKRFLKEVEQNLEHICDVHTTQTSSLDNT